ncbi:DUF6765 family protein [Spirochaeta dissipatitropha]
MNGEFHYYWIYILAIEAGFSAESSEILAIASQYPDENLQQIRVITEQNVYKSISTHHFGFWNEHAHREILAPFHFVPGDSKKATQVRIDGKPAPMTVTPHSPLAKKMFIEALKTRNLYRIGIALHAYADTWAHQNFSAFRHSANQLPEGSVLPAIGHAQYRLLPDILDKTWEDKRLIEPERRISNRSRFFEAAEMIYRYLCTYNKNDWERWPLVRSTIEEIIGAAGREKPVEERLLDYRIAYDIAPSQRHGWRNEAMQLDNPMNDKTEALQEKIRWFGTEIQVAAGKQKLVQAKAAPGFYKSHWFKWNEAAKAHRSVVLEMIKSS